MLKRWSMLALILSFTMVIAHAAPNAVIEGKRKLANDFFKDGKFGDVVTLLNEIISVEPNQFKDQLLLARTYTKLNQMPAAAEAYRRVLSVVPANATSSEEKSARIEAEKKLKELEPANEVIEKAIDQMLLTLDALEKDRSVARDQNALVKVYRLRGALFRADSQPDRAYAQINAAAGPTTVLTLKAGMKYRIRAAGFWKYGPKPEDQCTAAGNPNAAKVGELIYGSLGGWNGQKWVQLGVDTTITAPVNGPLQLGLTEPNQEAKSDNSGAVEVIIERVP